MHQPDRERYRNAAFNSTHPQWSRSIRANSQTLTLSLESVSLWLTCLRQPSHREDFLVERSESTRILLVTFSVWFCFSTARMARERTRREFVLGVVALVGVVALWVGASELSNFIFLDADYNKPLFLTYISTVMFALYLFGFAFPSWRADFDRHNLVPGRIFRGIAAHLYWPSVCGRCCSQPESPFEVDDEDSITVTHDNKDRETADTGDQTPLLESELPNAVSDFGEGAGAQDVSVSATSIQEGEQMSSPEKKLRKFSVAQVRSLR